MIRFDTLDKEMIIKAAAQGLGVDKETGEIFACWEWSEEWDDDNCPCNKCKFAYADMYEHYDCSKAAEDFLREEIDEEDTWTNKQKAEVMGIHKDTKKVVYCSVLECDNCLFGEWTPTHRDMNCADLMFDYLEKGEQND